MTIYNQIKNFLINRRGETVSSTEVKKELKARNGTNPSSIILSDFCYNRINNGIPFDKYIFEYVGRNLYIYLGENYPYNDKIYQKPINAKKDIVVGY